MSVQIKTEDGWKKSAGNVNPKLINDVNKRIDGYVDGGYLPNNLAKPISEWNSVVYPTAVGQDISNTTPSTRFATSQLLKGGVYTINVKTKGTVVLLAWGVNGTTVAKYSNFNVSLADNTQTFDGSAYEYVIFGIREDVSPQIVKNSVYQIQLNEGTVVNTYVPSNVELQSEIEPIPFPITIANANISSMTNNSFKIGHYVHLSAYFKVTENIGSYSSLFTLPETPKYRVDGQVNGINNFITNVYNTNAIIYSNGSIVASDDWRFIKADFCV